MSEARSVFARHLYEPWPTLASQRATSVTVDELVVLLARLVEAGKGRTAAKLRSYLRAAYALAIESKTDPDAPLVMRTFGITVSPAASIKALSKYNRALDRVLSAEELCAYLRRLEALAAAPQRDSLKLALFLGGQRPTQLLRVRPIDVDLDAGTVTLFDPKGRRKHARAHALPLTKKACTIFARLLSVNGEAPFLFTTDGTTAIHPSTISAEVAQICAVMKEAKEAREHFQLRDLRRTCETMLAALGVSSDTRAQLQSHGLGGVQHRHYDRHDYMAEKRRALEKWKRRLEEIFAGKAERIIRLLPSKGRREDDRSFGKST